MGYQRNFYKNTGKYPHYSHQGFQKGNSYGNLRKNKQPMLGKKHSETTKKKISKRHLGKKKPWAGKYDKNLRIRGEKCFLWKDGRCQNKEYVSWVKNKRNRLLNSGAVGSHTWGEWQTLKAQYNWICPCCGKKEPEIKLTEDHIIPLSKGGSDNIENVQPLCKSCNSKKYTKIIKYVPKQKVFS